MSAKNTPENFWARVRRAGKDDCWEWQGAKTSGGYGNLSWHGHHVQAHRVAFFLALGGIELQTGFRQKGQAKRYQRFVLHKCDNPSCCNPDHLFLGSMRANQLDAYAKGRRVQPRSGHVNAKLTKEQVRRVRHEYDSGQRSQSDIAREFGISQSAVGLIVRRETYKDVT